MHTQDMRQIAISIDGMDVDYELGKTLAEQVVSRLTEDYMMVAWYDGQKGEEHPDVPECQHKPGWLAYAEGHGGNIRVNFNDGEFEFIFSSV